MDLRKEELIKSILTRDLFYFNFSAATNMPYIVCDPETFNDQVWLFAEEEALKAYFEENKVNKIPLIGKRCEKKTYGNLFAQLRAIGVNEVVWIEGGEKVFFDLDEIAPEPPVSEEDKKKRPPMNPTLQLSAIYFVQEMRRPLTMEEHVANGVRELEEEMLVNICKGEYYILLRQDPNDEKKMGPVLIENKEKKMMLLPVFSDIMELTKMGQKNAGLRVIRVPFVKLKDLIPEQLYGIAVNPGGFNLSLSRDHVLKLIG